MINNFFKEILLVFILIQAIINFACSKNSTESKKDGGEVVWSYDIPDNYLDFVQPAIENGKVYVASDLNIRCFNMKNGDLLWESPYGNTSVFNSSKLLIDDNNVYLNHASWVKAFTKSDGSFKWFTDVNFYMPANSLAKMSQNENYLVHGDRNKVAVLLKSNGNVNVSIPLDSLKPIGIDQSSRNPELSDDELVYIPAGYFDPDNPPIKGNMFCYDAITGNYIWGFQVPNEKIKLPGNPDTTLRDSGIYGCTIIDSLIIFPASVAIYSLNRFNGKILWKNHFEEDGFQFGLTIYNNRIYVASVQGYVYCLDLYNGDILWQTNTTFSIFTILTVKDDRVYFCNNGGGKIWVLDANNGKVIWSSYPPDHPNDSYIAPVAVGEGYMVAVSSKKIYCYTIP